MQLKRLVLMVALALSGCSGTVDPQVKADVQEIVREAARIAAEEATKAARDAIRAELARREVQP